MIYIGCIIGFIFSLAIIPILLRFRFNRKIKPFAEAIKRNRDYFNWWNGIKR